MIENTENNIENKGPRFTLYDILRMILSNWYWFALSIVLCLLCAWLYLRYTSPIYQRSATVLVKDSRKGGSAEVTAFSDIMGLGRRSVDNEVHILQSRRLMEQVVNKYDLRTQYATKGRIRTRDMYGYAPLLVKFVDNNPHTKGRFKYQINGNHVVIDSFEIPSVDNLTFSATVLPGDTIATPLGKIVFVPTPYIERCADYEIYVSRHTLNNTVDAYCKRLNCTITDKMASVIAISMTDIVAKRAEDVINGVIEAYNADAIEDKRTISNITKEFIDERLVLLSEELNLADSDIATYKKHNQLYNLQSQAMLGAQEIQELKRQELSIEGHIEMAGYILDYIRSGNTEHDLIPASTVAMSGASNALASQIEEYNHSILEYKRLLSESSESNPMIVNLQSQIAQVRGTIISSLESHITGLKLQASQINREHRKANARLEDAPEKEKVLLSKTRQQKVKEELYIYLLTKLEENALVGATAESNARVIDFAYGADKPISPKRSMIYMLALVMGCAIPFTIIYLYELLNNTVRSRRDIESALTAPFLGDIPQFEKTNGTMAIVKEDSCDILSESFRMLRTNLSFMAVNNPIKVIMTTSSIPHSGKTFISSNLAAMIAASGKRVLLMDIDLRRRTLTKNMGHRNDRRGLTSYLTGKIGSIEDIISESELAPGLDIVYAGPQPPNPAEMLMSSQMENLMTELRNRYDYIIVDSVPAMAVADALIVDRLADLTIYVVRCGNLKLDQLHEIEELNKTKKIHNMCVVFNGASATKHSYSYKYNYLSEEDLPQWKRNLKRVKRLFTKRD